ncbi:MCE family protein [Nocardia wallacei]|uniref:MCE family protein n=1 Tax=Nocardia wallacei TaxID=480035 RepID=UPI0024580DA1|nr:MCE family protein [Nocardia wallacei]
MSWRKTVARRRIRGRTLEEYHPAWLGTLAIAALVVAVAVALTINSLSIGDKRIEADFAQAAQLGAGDQVTVAGVPVGSVARVRLAGDHVAVTLSIGADVHLGADTTASIKLTTLLGNRYVELAPAGSGSLASGRIPLAHTSVPYDLQSALSDATKTFDQVDADQVATALTDLSGRLDGLPQLIPSVLQNISTLSSVIAERRGQIGALLDSTSRLTTAIENQRANLGALFTQGSGLLQDILAHKQAIDTMIAATTTLVNTLKPLAVDDQPQIQSLLTNLSAMTGKLSRHDDLMRNILEILPVPWRSWANLTGTGPEMDVNAPSGAFVDSFMCALVLRAPQARISPYSEDCK